MNKSTIAAVLLVVLLTAGTIFGSIFMDNRKSLVEISPPDNSNSEGKAEQEKPKENAEKPKEETSVKAPSEEAPSEEAPSKEGGAFLKEKEKFNLILANAENPLPDGFEVTVDDVPNGFKTDARIAEILREMIDAADADGVDLLLCSGYRSNERQEELFNAEKSDYLAEGKSEAEASKLAAVAIAIPGTSEHETGLAVDIVTTEYQNLNEGFEETAAFKWLDKNASDYGFILRYPKDKQDITGIMYEAWHYRYVGKQHAKLIKDSGLCLEEYLEQTAPEGFTPEAE